MNSDLDISSLKCWIVGEGLAGTENQCIGVAESLGVKPVIKRIELREPWKSFSPALGFEQWWGFKPMMYPPWPDLVIAAGRKAVAPARFIRKAARAYEGNDCFTVFLQDPKCKTNDFDMVCAPKHDELDGANVLTTVASPNRISEALLKAAKAEFSYLGTPPLYGGALKPFPSEIKQGKLEVWAYEPLNDVAKIANAIGTALKKRNNKKVKTS